MEDALTLPDGRTVYALTLRDVALLASVSKKTVWRHTKKGILKTVRRGGKLLVPISEFRIYVGASPQAI